jgi:hypothetical protein
MQEGWRYNDTPQMYIDGFSLYNVAFRGNNEETTGHTLHPLLHNTASADDICNLKLWLVISTGNYCTKKEYDNTRKLLFTFTRLLGYPKQGNTNPVSPA